MIAASLFQTFIVQPVFNLLVFIYALLPGHNFGLAIVIFTVVTRFLMWPLIKKQLHHTKAMRAMQPEIKRIKAESKGDRQKESTLLMELYKERQVSPFGMIGITIVQFIILIGLYQGLSKVIHDPRALIDNAYQPIRQLGWLKSLAADINLFDNSFLGIDLGRAAISKSGYYWPAMFLVIASAVSQYYQSKQLMPNDKQARRLRDILKDAGKGKQAESDEVNAAVGRGTKYLIPIMIFIFTVNFAAALSLYWLVSGLTAFWQQSRILSQDENEMEAIADSKITITNAQGEVIDTQTSKGRGKKRSSRSKRGTK